MSASYGGVCFQCGKVISVYATERLCSVFALFLSDSNKRYWMCEQEILDGAEKAVKSYENPSWMFAYLIAGGLVLPVVT